MSEKSVSSVTIARPSRTHADATTGSVAPAEILVENGHGVMAGPTEQFGEFGRKVLIHLEPHADYPENDTTRSLANSAA